MNFLSALILLQLLAMQACLLRVGVAGDFALPPSGHERAHCLSCQPLQPYESCNGLWFSIVAVNCFLETVAGADLYDPISGHAMLRKSRVDELRAGLQLL